MMKIPAPNKVFIAGIALLLLSVSLIIIISVSQFKNVNKTAKLVDHTREVLFNAERMISIVMETETSSRAYLLTGQPYFLETFEQSKKEFTVVLGSLRHLTGDNLLQQQRIDSVAALVNRRTEFSERAIRAERNIKQLPVTNTIALRSNEFLNNIKQLASQIRSDETMLLQSSQKANKEAQIVQYYVLLAVVTFIVGFILLVFWKAGKLAQEVQQKKSEAMFRGLLESAPDAMIIVNDKDEVVLTNRQTEKLFGFSKEELVGRSVELLLPEDFKPANIYRQNGFGKDALGSLVYTGRELEVMKRNAEKFPVEITIAPFATEKGTLVSASIRDITQRKKAQALVETLSLQIDQASDAIYTVGANGKISAWNRGAEIMYGYSKEEMLGKDSNEVLQTVITREKMDSLSRIIAGQDYWTGELQRKTKNGEDIFIRSSNTTIRDDKGIITGYIVVNYNITLQKKLGEQLTHLANMVEQSTEAIISTGLDLRVISWNNGAEKLHGYTKEEAIGRTSADLGLIIPEECLDDLLVHLMDKGAWQKDVTFFHKNGTAFFGSMTGNVIKNDQGEITSIVFIIKDISNQKQLEEQLKKSNEGLEAKVKARTEALDKSEKRFRALIENNFDIICLFDKSFKFFYRSPSAYRISGWTNEEMENQEAQKNIHPDDIEKTTVILGEVAENPGKPVNALFRNKHKNGHYLWLEGVMINLLHDVNVNAIVFNFRDVTERIEADEKLAASEIRFRSLIENSAEGIAMTDAFSNNIYRSPGAEKITGDLPKDNTINLTHPDDMETIRNKRLEVLRKPGVPVPFQGRFLHAAGHYFWLEGTFTNLLHKKGVNAIVSNYRDITERKKAEEQLVKSEKIYKTIATSIPGSVICLFDEEYRYLLIEGDMLEKLGYVKEKLLGNKIEDVLPAERAVIIRNDFERVFNGETIIKESSLNGFDIVSRYIPLKDENEKVYSVMTAAIDVTQLKIAQRDIAELNRNLEEKIALRTAQLSRSNEELEAFSYSISHDLRAPLRAIVGFSAILEEDYTVDLDEEAKRIISIIKKNTLKMGHLIDDLLSFSRMNRQQIVKINIDVNEMVREVIAGLDNNNSRVQIAWIISVLPEMKADPGSIRQVWTNLISNAIKYSGKRDLPSIEIGANKNENETTYFIRDNGVGFDDKYAKKLFKVFQRLHKDIEFEGTGVGLAIVEKIVSKHGGSVWAEAVPDVGACFYFSLPNSEQST